MAASLALGLWAALVAGPAAAQTDTPPPPPPRLSAAIPDGAGSEPRSAPAPSAPLASPDASGVILGGAPGGSAIGGFGEGGASTGTGPVTNLPLPRFVSLRSDEINVRRGPGLDYRTDWVFRQAGMPVKVINEFGDWRQIIDSDQATGWIYHALLTGRRTVLVTDRLVDLRAGPEADRAIRARAEQGVVADLRQCERDWCEIEADGHGGWVPKSVIWGVEPGEIYPR